MPTLKVNVVEATNLFGADFDGKSDPYCLLKIGEGNQFSCIERTRKIKNTKNPTWKEVFTLNVNNPLTENLFIEVMNKESRGKDNSLGYASMPLHDLTRGIEKQVWLQLEGGSSSSGGVLGSLVHLGKKKEKVNEGKVFLGVTALDFGLEPSTYPPGQGGMMHGVPQQGVQSAHLPGMQQGMQQGIQPGMQQGIQQPGMHQGVQPGLQQGIQPGMQQGMQPGMHQGVQPGIQQSNLSSDSDSDNEGKHGEKRKHGEHGHRHQEQGTIYHEPSQPIYPPQQYAQQGMQQGIQQPGMHQGVQPGMQQGVQQPNLQQPGLQSIPQSSGVQQHGQQTTIPQSGIQQGQGQYQPGMPQPGMQYPSSGSQQTSSSNKGVYPEHL